MSDSNAMTPIPRDEYLVVWLDKPMLGTDPDDGIEFTADRHKVPARWVRQDPNETVFIDDLGVIVGRWPTPAILRFDWPDVKPAVDHEATRNEAWEDRFEKILTKCPQAWTKWSDEEDAQLVAEFEAGLTAKEIGARHSRTVGAIRSRLAKVELFERGTSESAFDAR